MSDRDFTDIEKNPVERKPTRFKDLRPAERKHLRLKAAGLSEMEIQRRADYDQELERNISKAIAEGSSYADLPKTSYSGSGKLNPFLHNDDSDSPQPGLHRRHIFGSRLHTFRDIQETPSGEGLVKGTFSNNADIDGDWLRLESLVSSYQKPVPDIFDPTQLTGNPIVEGYRLGTQKMEQINQCFVSDGSRSAQKTMAFGQQPLEDLPYHERKLSVIKLLEQQRQLAEQQRQLKIRQEYLETLTGARLPRFLVPDISEFPFDPQTQYKGLLLPYRRCLFLLNPGPELQLVYVEQLDTDKVLFTVKAPTQTVEDNRLIGQFTFWWDGQLREDSWFIDAQAEADSQQARVILTILDGLSKGYTITEGDAPPTDRKIPEARKGCTVRVVKLHPNAAKIRKAWQGGTHASPREHTRRAHWRRNCHGVWKRIGELVVNKGVEGVIGKDYVVKKRKPKPEDSPQE